MFQYLPSRQAACYHHTLSDEQVADQVNDQVKLVHWPLVGGTARRGLGWAAARSSEPRPTLGWYAESDVCSAVGRYDLRPGMLPGLCSGQRVDKVLTPFGPPASSALLRR